MARIPDLRRIQKEDFEEDYQDLVDKLAFPLNNFMEQVRAAFTKSIDFTNLNQEIITIDVTVDVNGEPLVDTKYRSNLNTRVIGQVCINATNLTNSNTYPTNQPFITSLQNEKIVAIKHISGLQANNKYRLTLLTIGA